MMLRGPCVLTQPYAGHIYGIIKPQCFSWEHNDKDYPLYWCNEGSHRSYVGRCLYQGEMLIGKVTSNFYDIEPNAISLVIGGSYKILVVDSSCGVVWVPHDANAGQPLPADALVGGVITATNLPLYVACQPYGTRYMGGYYNPMSSQTSSTQWISVYETLWPRRVYQRSCKCSFSYLWDFWRYWWYCMGSTTFTVVYNWYSCSSEAAIPS